MEKQSIAEGKGAPEVSHGDWKPREIIRVRRDWDCMKCGAVIPKGSDCRRMIDKSGVVKTPHDDGLRLCLECDKDNTLSADFLGDGQ